MASSLEVMRQRITSPGMTSPGHYPVPPAAQRRFIPVGALAAAQSQHMGHQSRILPVGFEGRHSWSAVTSPNNSLLSNRIQRLNLRLSAPTPGEEELCRHWMQNSAKFCRRQNSKNSKARNKIKNIERPKTVQTPPNQMYKDLLPQRAKSASRKKITVRMTSPNHDYVTSSDSERIASPSASQRSSPGTGSRNIGNKYPVGRRPSTSSYGHAETPGNSPTNEHRPDSADVRSQPRPPSARPSEARWRNRSRASHSPTNLRTGSAGNSRGNTEIRRWSLSEAMMNQQNDSKDDDSAYSSSRDVTMPGSPPGSPPRSAPNFQSRDEHFQPSARMTRVRGQSSRVMVSGQDGRPVFYYHHQHNQAVDRQQLLHHSSSNGQNLLPLRHSGNTLSRPVTQPAMGTQHFRNHHRRIPVRHNKENPEDKLIQRVLPPALPPSSDPKTKGAGPKLQPLSLVDYDVINKQRMMFMNEQSKSLNQFIEPEVFKRIVTWLQNVEQNPDLYYGFETDLFGGSIRSSHS